MVYAGIHQDREIGVKTIGAEVAGQGNAAVGLQPILPRIVAVERDEPKSLRVERRQANTDALRADDVALAQSRALVAEMNQRIFAATLGDFRVMNFWQKIASPVTILPFRSSRSKSLSASGFPGPCRVTPPAEASSEGRSQRPSSKP
jgi:hypothetical protein